MKGASACTRGLMHANAPVSICCRICPPICCWHQRQTTGPFYWSGAVLAGSIFTDPLYQVCGVGGHALKEISESALPMHLSPDPVLATRREIILEDTSYLYKWERGKIHIWNPKKLSKTGRATWEKGNLHTFYYWHTFYWVLTCHSRLGLHQCMRFPYSVP